MLRLLTSNALRIVASAKPVSFAVSPVQRAFSAFCCNTFTPKLLVNSPSTVNAQLATKQLSSPTSALTQLPTVRYLTKFSLNKGKRKSVTAVTKRFKRLDWGIWIRTYCGRHKKLFKKSAPRRRRLRQHVFTNATQSFLLDKMVTSFWRRPKYYIDDPYAPYHQRNEFFATKAKTFKV